MEIYPKSLLFFSSPFLQSPFHHPLQFLSGLLVADTCIPGSLFFDILFYGLLLPNSMVPNGMVDILVLDTLFLGSPFPNTLNPDNLLHGTLYLGPL